MSPLRSPLPPRQTHCLWPVKQKARSHYGNGTLRVCSAEAWQLTVQPQRGYKKGQWTDGRINGMQQYLSFLLGQNKVIIRNTEVCCGNSRLEESSIHTKSLCAGRLKKVSLSVRSLMPSCLINYSDLFPLLLKQALNQLSHRLCTDFSPTIPPRSSSPDV